MANAVIHPRVLPLSAERLGFAAGGVSVLSDVSLTINVGSRNVVMGPNGAGKSVLMRLLHGLLTPTAGVVKWSTMEKSAVRRAQAMVFQRPVMLRRTVRENVEFGLQLLGRDNVPAAAQAALECVGLVHLADRAARLCSGGEQQRVALARAWALQPEVLFLDEPTASLDPAATKAIEETISAIHAQGTTIVMTTHNLGQARRIADRVLFLHHGRLIEDTSADIFFQQPQSPEAAAFIQGELLW